VSLTIKNQLSPMQTATTANAGTATVSKETLTSFFEELQLLIDGDQSMENDRPVLSLTETGELVHVTLGNQYFESIYGKTFLDSYDVLELNHTNVEVLKKGKQYIFHVDVYDECSENGYQNTLIDLDGNLFFQYEFIDEYEETPIYVNNDKGILYYSREDMTDAKEVILFKNLHLNLDDYAPTWSTYSVEKTDEGYIFEYDLAKPPLGYEPSHKDLLVVKIGNNGDYLGKEMYEDLGFYDEIPPFRIG
jgi:hypothetical protein